MLWLVLYPEASHPCGKVGGAAVTTRGQLWKRVEELLAALKVPRDQWRDGWLAQAADRAAWRKGMKVHRRQLRQEAAADCWEARHAPGGRAARKEAARVRNVMSYGRGQ